MRACRNEQWTVGAPWSRKDTSQPSHRRPLVQLFDLSPRRAGYQRARAASKAAIFISNASFCSEEMEPAIYRSAT